MDVGSESRRQRTDEPVRAWRAVGVSNVGVGYVLELANWSALQQRSAS